MGGGVGRWQPAPVPSLGRWQQINQRPGYEPGLPLHTLTFLIEIPKRLYVPAQLTPPPLEEEEEEITHKQHTVNKQ